MDLVEMGGLDPRAALRHWYFRSKYRLLRLHLDSLPPSVRSGTLADFGCGAGVFLSMLGRDAFMNPGQMVGIDNSPLAPLTCTLGSSAILPTFPTGSRFDLILAMDVLEHCENDLRILQTISAHCGEGGWVFITVPAHQWLWSPHDVFLGHHRRYNRSGLRDLIKRCGSLEVLSIHYHFALLLLPVAVRRIARRLAAGAPVSDLKPHSRWFSDMLCALCGIELTVSRSNRWCGLTLAVLCRKLK